MVLPIPAERQVSGARPGKFTELLMAILESAAVSVERPAAVIVGQLPNPMTTGHEEQNLLQYCTKLQMEQIRRFTRS